MIKWDSELKLVAAAIFAYVDDLRIIAATRELAWQASRRAASYIQFLGAQDAPRKRRLDNGPWAGTVFNTKDGSIIKSVTQSKWDRGRSLIQELIDEVKADPETLFDFKRLE